MNSKLITGPYHGRAYLILWAHLSSTSLSLISEMMLIISSSLLQTMHARMATTSTCCQFSHIPSPVSLASCLTQDVSHAHLQVFPNQVPVTRLLTWTWCTCIHTPDKGFDMYGHMLQFYWSVACEGWYLKAAGLVIMMSCWVGEYLGLRGMNAVYYRCCTNKSYTATWTIVLF